VMMAPIHGLMRKIWGLLSACTDADRASGLLRTDTRRSDRPHDLREDNDEACPGSNIWEQLLHILTMACSPKRCIEETP
jgi:hypothetical protein